MAACGGGSDATGPVGSPDAGATDCAPPVWPDDIVLETDTEIELPGEIHRIVAAGDRALACGDSFVATATSTVELAAACAGLAAERDRAIAAGRDGTLTLLSIGAGGELGVVGTIERAVAAAHDVVLSGDRALVAAGVEGIVSFTVAADFLAPSGPVAGALDARGVRVLGDALLVADGARGAVLLDASGAGLRAEAPVEGIAMRVIAEGSRAAVLLGAEGAALYEIGEGELRAVALLPTQGVVVDGLLRGSDLLLVEGAEIVRFVFTENGGVERRTSQDRRGAGRLVAPWLRAIGEVGGDVLAGEGRALVSLELGSGTPAPELQVDRTSTSLGEAGEALVRADNEGSADLVLLAVTAASPFSAAIPPELQPPLSRPGCPGQSIVAAGEPLLASVSLPPQGPAGAAGALTISTDDADEPELLVALDGGRPALAEGDAAPDFSVLTVTGELFRLSDHAGRVVLIKLFNFG